MSDINKGEKWIVHGLINIFMVFMIFTMVLMCGFIKNDEGLTVFKTYNGVIYQGNEKNNKVALMINVYWGTEYLEKMLDILEKHNAKATFFVGTTWVEENPQMLKKIHSQGHEIGNHGSNHKEHGKLSFDANLSEIDECSKVVQKTINMKMSLFAPPGGSYNKQTVKAAESLGYKTILWTHDTIDWRDQNADIIFSRATKNVFSGDLILMHPTRATLEALEKIIIALNGKKLTLDTVSNTIKD